jgi:hypothetical protein
MASETPMKLAAPHGEADQQWLRECLLKLEQIDRPSASAGERLAAEWLVGEFAKLGAEARIETEKAHGTYWWPIGIGTALGVAGGLATRKGHRLTGALLGAAGAAAIATDFPPRPRYLRRVLPKRDTCNVICELGDPQAKRTVVLSSHHDAANQGLVFHPGIPKLVSKTGAFDHLDTSPMLMAPVIGGPVLSALGGLTGSRHLANAGIALSAGSTAAMADIGLRKVVPGANDNGTAVIALLELARRFLADPPADLRLVLVSFGAEESFSEGMKAFGERYFPELPVDSTFFINMDTIGSPHLTVLRGEGFLKMFEYPAGSLILADRAAEEEDIDLMPNLRIHNGTDGLEALAAGYPVVSICSCTDSKQPANYHWPNDITENIDFDTVESGIRLAESMTRRLSGSWA